MERTQPDAFGALANGLHDPVFHLTGSLVGECESENVLAGKLGLRFKEVADSLGDDPRLAGSRACHDK